MGEANAEQSPDEITPLTEQAIPSAMVETSDDRMRPNKFRVSRWWPLLLIPVASLLAMALASLTWLSWSFFVGIVVAILALLAWFVSSVRLYEPMPNVPPREPVPNPSVDPARVPRQFGMRFLVILVTVYAVLFSVLRTIDAPPGVFVLVGGYLTIIILGQVVLFGGKKPRWASVVAGVGAYYLLFACSMIVGVADGTPSTTRFLAEISGAVVCGSVWTALFSYVVGCLVSGVFLILDRLQTGQWNPPQEMLAPKKPETESPWDLKEPEEPPKGVSS